MSPSDLEQIVLLGAWGETEADLPGVADKAAKASSMQANPLPLTEEELIAVVRAALEDRRRQAPLPR